MSTIPFLAGALALLVPATVLAQGTDPTAPPVGEHVLQPEYSPAFDGADEPLPQWLPQGVNERPSFVRDRVAYLEESGALWARGRNYKAAASPTGFQFIPFLGSEAARNWPVSFRLRRAAVGAEELQLEPMAEVRRAGDRITLDRGPVDVHYALELDQVEQLFTFDAVHQGGAIVLELEVETDLVARRVGAGFAFDGPEGGVEYGAAVAFDETGRTVALESALEEGVLRLTVPAAFVASATGHITVDPVINSTLTDDYTENLLRPDIGYDTSTDSFLVAYEEQFSFADNDIFSSRINTNGAVLSTNYASLSAFNATAPSVATQNADDAGLVVFQRETAGPNDEIVGRLYGFQTASYGAEVVIGDDARPNSRPDVGGNGSTNPNGVFMVVWLRESSAGVIRSYLRSVATNGSLGTRFQTGTTSNSTQEEVVVSKSTGAAAAVNHWNIATKSVDLTTGIVSLRSLRMNVNGINSLGSESDVQVFPAGTDIGQIDISDALPAQSGTGATLLPTYLISYDIAGTTDEDTFLAITRDDELVVAGPLQVIEHADTSRSQVLARLSTTANDYMVTYCEQRPGSLIFDIYMTTLDLVEGNFLAVNERRVHLGDTGGLFDTGAAMASRFSGGRVGSAWVMTSWSRFETVGTDSTRNIRSSLFGVRATRAIAPQYCYGTPNSTGERAFMTIVGNNDTTSAKRVMAEGLPPFQFSLLGIGTLPVQVFPVPNTAGTLCIGGLVGRFNTLITQADANGLVQIDFDPAVLPTPTTIESATAGMTRAFQLWYRDFTPAGGSSSNFTNGAALAFR